MEAQAARVAFDEEFAEGVACFRNRARGLVIAVRIPLAQSTVLKLEDQQSAILALDDRVQAAQPCGDPRNVTGEIAECVDVMHAGLIDKQAWVIAEIGLARDVGVLSPAIAHAGAEMKRMQLVTDGPGIDEALDLAMPRLEAEVLMHDEAHVCGSGIGDDFTGNLYRGTEGLLTNDIDTALGSFRTYFPMR